MVFARALEGKGRALIGQCALPPLIPSPCLDRSGRLLGCDLPLFGRDRTSRRTGRLRRAAMQARASEGSFLAKAQSLNLLQGKSGQLRGAPAGDHAPASQVQVLVGHVQEAVQAMLRHHHGGSARFQARQNLHERGGALRVQVAGGLVQHEHRRLARDGGSQRHALLLAARQRGQPLSHKPLHAADLGGGAHAARDLGGIHAQVLGRERDLVAHRSHEELAARILHHHAEPLGALPRGEPAHVRAAHLHDAREVAGEERARKAVDHAQHGGLPLARAPAQHKAAAGGHRQRHVAHALARRGRRGGDGERLFRLALGLVHIAKRGPVEQHGRRPFAFASCRHANPSPAHSPTHTATTAAATSASRAPSPTW